MQESRIKDYEIVSTLEEAAERLAEPGWAVLGGGSHLVPSLPAAVDKILDPMLLGLDFLNDDDDDLRLGARLRLEALAQRDDFDGLLSAAAMSLAPSINERNQKTVAGELAWPHADSEWQAALLALDATMERFGHEDTSADDYLQGAERDGLITALRLPRPKGQRCRFERVAAASGSRPELAVAAAAVVRGGAIESVRIAVTGLGLPAARIKDVESGLTGADTASLDSWALPAGAVPDEKTALTEKLIARFLFSLAGEVGK